MIDKAKAKGKERKAEGFRLSKEAKAKAPEFIKKGKSLIKPGLESMWEELVKENSKDPYNASAFEACLQIMGVLSEGKSPEEAVEIVSEEILDFGVWVAQKVSYFHPRGEEFRQYWNRLYLSEQESRKTKGVVNPATRTIYPAFPPE